MQIHGKIVGQAFVDKLMEKNLYYIKAKSRPFDKVVDIINSSVKLNLFEIVRQNSQHQVIKID